MLEVMAQPSAPAVSVAPQLAAQHGALLDRCGLLDRSERGKLALTGSGAAEFLNGQVTNDVVSLSPGQGCYAAFLTHKGKMLGDLRILVTESELLLDTERIALQGLFDMIRRFKIGYDVELHKRTLERGLLSLIGPKAQAVVTAAIEGGAPGTAVAEVSGAAKGTPDTAMGEVPGAAEGTPDTAMGEVPGAAEGPPDTAMGEVPGAAEGPPDTAMGEVPGAAEGPPDTAAGKVPGTEHAHFTGRIAGVEVRLIATAQPEGVDVLCDSSDTERLMQALLTAGAEQVEEDAVEIVRVEQGEPRYGIDLDDGVIPQEADLNERAVSFTKGCYVGQETVARLHYRGKPNRRLRGLRLSAPLERGTELHLDGKLVGHLTSSVVSPTLGPIGLSLLRKEAEVGATLSANEGGASAEVVLLPFSG